MGRTLRRNAALLSAALVAATGATTDGGPVDAAGETGETRDGDSGICDPGRCDAECPAAGFAGGGCNSGLCVCSNNPDADADPDVGAQRSPSAICLEALAAREVHRGPPRCPSPCRWNVTQRGSATRQGEGKGKAARRPETHDVTGAEGRSILRIVVEGRLR